jgi:anthranilate synthase component 1
MSEKACSTIKVSTLLHQMAGVFDPTYFPQNSSMLLLESADVITKLGEKSLLYFDFALKIKAFNNQVLVESLMDEALPLFEVIKSIFKEKVLKEDKNCFTIKMDPLYHHQDLLEKMAAPSALDVLRAIIKALAIEGAHKKNFMLAGAFSYDFLDHFEKLPMAKMGDDVPDYLFYVPLSLILIDHKNKCTSIFAHALGDNIDQAQLRLAKALELKTDASKNISRHNFAFNAARPKFEPDVADEEFFSMIDKCMTHIHQGDVYQIVPSRTFSSVAKDPILCYRALRHTNASPYMFYMRSDDWTLFGASPETFIKVEGNTVSVRPIAGTRRRGFFPSGEIDHELDSREQASLCLDEKELAEHMMLVDLARNDIASVSKPKTRRVKRLLSVDRFSHVMHLVSEVEGELKEGFDCFSAYQASMNMGTLMGAPKVRAAELLRGIEKSKRGFYGGAIGYIDCLGNMDTAIIIRSALVKDGIAKVRTGCGVVYDSTPLFEAEETKNKAEGVLKAIEIAGNS